MRWLKDVCALDMLYEAVIAFVSVGSSSMGDFTQQMEREIARLQEIHTLSAAEKATMEKLTALTQPGLSEPRDQLLALRGLLAYGLLEHCLTKRHHVDFGVDRRAGKRRRVAVPFRSNDTPAERSEFAHPDTLIVYTHLAYYGDGLTHAELKQVYTLTP